MKIANSLLADFLHRCSKKISWSEKELEQIYPSLQKIALYNGGRIVGQTELAAETEESYILDRLEKGIKKIMMHYAKAVATDPEKERYYSFTEDVQVPFASLAASAFIEKVDINSAGVKDLEQLENIGKAKAAQIVQHREKHGYFKSIEELIQVKGIGPSHVASLSYATKAIPAADDKPIFISPLLLQFKKEPTLANYLQVIKETGGIFSSTKQPGKLREKLADEKEFKRTIILEFQIMAEYLAANSHQSYGKYGSTQRKKIAEWDMRRKKVRKLEKEGQADTIRVAILDDMDYFPFIQEMLQGAKKRIHVVMFLVHLNEREENAPRKLLEELAAKKKKGLDVKVILDRCGENNDYSVNRVNQAAVEFLRKNGIPLLLDYEEIKTHTKLVLVDDEHTVVGSHNWTSGSFFRYDDKSAYVQSRDFCHRLSRHFSELWGEYSKIGK